MRLTLRALSLGNFAIGTGAFVVPSLLNPISESLGEPVVIAGQLLAVYALAYAILSPVLISLTSHVPRRQLLLIGLGVFAGANVLSAASTELWMLFAARVLAACGACVFTPTASAVTVATSPPEARGKALATVFLGLGMAQVVGIPVGALVGFAAGWRVTFLVVALLAIGAALVLARVVPRGLEGQRLDLRAWARLLGDSRTALALSVTLIQFIGQFIPYSYIGPWLGSALSLGSGGIAALLWIYGVCATAGGLVGGWSADRFGLLPTLVTILAIMGIGIVAMSAGAGSLAAMLVAMAVWGMTGFAFNAPQQSRLVSMAPEAVGIVLALNASALYVGTAAGGAIGGVVVTAFGLDALGWAGGIFVAIAILALLASARPRTPQAAVR